MASELQRLVLSLDEVIKPKQLKEVELPETVDMGNSTMDETMSPMEAFNYGLENSQATTLSNLIAKKVNKSKFDLSTSLSDILSAMESTWLMLFKLIKALLGTKSNGVK